jgi:hypothetical protein
MQLLLYSQTCTAHQKGLFMDDPARFGGVMGLITHLHLIPRVSERYRLAICGYGTKMSCFAVLDTEHNEVYSAAHTWNKTGVRLLRFVTSPRQDCYVALYDKHQIGESDVVRSTYHHTSDNQIPIMQPLPWTGFQLTKRELTGVTRLQSLLDGSFHPVTQSLMVNERAGVEIDTPTYPGHSGLGFIDEHGGLYLVSGGRGSMYERTFLSHATD